MKMKLLGQDDTDTCDTPDSSSRTASGKMIESFRKRLGIRFAAYQHWGPHPVVGFSALCFGFPASAFFAVELCILRETNPPYPGKTDVQLLFYPVLGVVYAGAIFTCVLADFVFIKCGHRSFYGKVDIIWARCVFILSIVDFALRGSVLETACLIAIAVAAFVFSGCSPSFEQWVWRHTLWHIVGSAVGAYGALRLPPEQVHISDKLWAYVSIAFATYILSATCFLLVFNCAVPVARRIAWWERGSIYANWCPVNQS